jgi:hypothetical protein
VSARTLSLRIKQPRHEADHVHLVSRLGIRGVTPPLPPPVCFRGVPRATVPHDIRLEAVNEIFCGREPRQRENDSNPIPLMGTQSVPKTSEHFNTFTHLSAREDFLSALPQFTFSLCR